MVCTFFGHRTVPDSIRPILYCILTDLIENHGADTFFVGDQGEFDRMAKTELKKLTKIYPHIRYSVVLAYLPKKDNGDLENTIYPDGLENTPLRFAIDRRNRMMIGWSDAVITYVCHSFGGAAKYENIAKKKGRWVINLFDFNPQHQTEPFSNSLHMCETS